ncbi:MAG: hypothetical protein PWQ82_195 [Thermosediminibacterales bacterium]|nr:hypothetical protein [Thermosediminibacterales bacterium]MDK2835360.1 hypothetical protein [Thermosediminibacterales bacterium]
MQKGNRKNAMKFIVMLGIVSLFSDITYEGARSVTGPFLELLGASASVVGFVAGFGEFVGYGLRLLTGYFADRTARYWLFTGIGYAINLLAVPLLALAGNWQIAAMLVVMERLGKAVRTPAKDVMLSHATSEVGRGWGFAIHEAMDQIGAVAGPLIVSAAVFVKGNFRSGFAILLLPAVLALVTLLVARINFPQPHELEETSESNEQSSGNMKLPRLFWLYSLFIALTVAGFIHFQLISFHLEKQGVISEAYIPVLFSIAMGVDALAALLAGKIYDRVGIASLLAVPVLTAVIPFLVFKTSYPLVLLGIVLWGIIMGIQETIMKASIADMVSTKRRGTAFGIFNTAFGLSWFIGSAASGRLYDISVTYIKIFVTLTQAAALFFFIILYLREKSFISPRTRL